MSKIDTFRRFCSIIGEHGILSASQYDELEIPNKPSRRALYSYFGPWRNVLSAYVQSLRDPGDVRFKGAAKASQGEDEQHPEVQKLMQQVADLQRHIQTPKLHLDGVEFKFGVISDTHIGSLFADLGLLRTAYDIFASKGISTVLHAGDLLDGQKVYAGHDFEVSEMGADGQIELCVREFPFKSGITTYFINGNHDRSFWKRSGIDVGPKISAERTDLVYLGYQEEDVVLGDPPAQIVVRLFHPEGSGSAYALSYLAQRYISELTEKNKPHLLIHGHTHKFNYMRYQDVFSLQAGCLQAQTPFMRGRKLASHLGFSVVELTATEGGIANMKVEFFPCY